MTGCQKLQKLYIRARVCLTFTMLTDLSQQASTKICWTQEGST